MVNLVEFMRRVKIANTNYERFIKSSLHDLVKTIKANPRGYEAIVTEMNKIPSQKLNKYASAIGYLNNLPGIRLCKAGTARGNQVRNIICSQSGLRGILDKQRRLAANDINIQRSISQQLNGSHYAWDVKLRIRIHGLGEWSRRKHSLATITVFVPVIALNGNAAPNGIPDDSIAMAASDEIKRSWAATIAERWHGAEYLVKNNRTGDIMHKYDIVCRIDWVTDSNDAAYTVYCVRSTIANHDGTVDMCFWGADDGRAGKSAIAHEYGHMLGNPDEYGTVNFNGRQVTYNGGIMDDEHTRPKPGHFYLIANAVRTHGITPHRNQTHYIKLGVHQYRVGSEHPWVG